MTHDLINLAIIAFTCAFAWVATRDLRKGH